VFFDDFWLLHGKISLKMGKTLPQATAGAPAAIKWEMYGYHIHNSMTGP